MNTSHSSQEETVRRESSALRTGTSYETIRIRFDCSEPPLRHSISVILNVNKNRSKNSNRKSNSTLDGSALYGTPPNPDLFVLRSPACISRSNDEEAMNNVSPVDLGFEIILYPTYKCAIRLNCPSSTRDVCPVARQMCLPLISDNR